MYHGYTNNLWKNNKRDKVMPSKTFLFDVYCLVTHEAARTTVFFRCLKPVLYIRLSSTTFLNYLFSITKSN